MAADEDPRALDFCAVGLGQGGGNLAAEWRRRGYRAILLNTARSDLRGLSRSRELEIPEKYRVHIGIGGTDGAGKDPDYGAACLREHADLVRASIEENLQGADALVLCAGLGGGTGSAVPELLRLVESIEIPTIAVVTLPAHAESGIAKVNAVKTANALVTAPLNGRVFIDNERLVEAFPDVDVISYYPTVNAEVLGPLDALNRLNARRDLYSIRSFDGEDMRKVVLSGGVLQTHIERLDDKRAPSAADLIGVVAHCVNGGRHLAPGLTLEQCAYLALVVVGPERVLKKTPIQVFDEAISALKEKTKGGAVYEGLYVGPDDTPLEVYVLSASMALPARVKDLLGDAQTEGQDLMRKISEEIPELEISPLEGLDLFRAPARRRGNAARGARPAPPKPRPLGDQLMGESAGGVLRTRPPSERLSIPVVEPKGRSAEGPPSSSARATPEEPTGIYGDKRAPTPKPDAARPSTRARGEEPVVPKVGTGRYDEVEAGKLEPTLQVEGSEAKKLLGQSVPERTDHLRTDDRRALDSDVIAAAHTVPPSEPTMHVDRGSLDGPPAAKPDDISLPDEFSLSERPVPRVGSGRHDDVVEQEPTEYRHDLLSAPPTDADQEPVEAKAAAPMVAVGTGRADVDAHREVPEETMPAPAARAPAPVGEARELVPGDSGLFNPDDLPFEYDIAVEAPAFENQMTRPVDEDAILAADQLIDDDHEPDTLASLRRPTVVSNLDDMLLSSIVGGDPRGGGTGLQNVYEDLIDRFRQAADRRGRERVARRLIDDSRADDVEVRALAVWAMVKLEEKGFRRALAKSANDENPEISKLAISGLERIELKRGPNGP